MEPTIPVQGEPEESKLIAYFLGALRDGCLIRNVKNSTYRIRIYQKNWEWIETLSVFAEKLFNKKPIVSIDQRDGVWSLMINSKDIFERIIEISGYPDSQRKWCTPPFVLGASSDIQKEYVKGFFDAEGGVPHVENKSIEAKNIRIHFTQSNKTCLEELKMMISNLGIRTGMVCGPYYKRGYKHPVFRLKIHGIREVAKFFDSIGSLHPEKSQRLSIIKQRVQIEA